MHAILPSLCSGCELCVAPCPVDCIAMVAGRPRVDARRRRRRARSAPRARRAARRSASGSRSARPSPRSRRRAARDAAGRGRRRAGPRARAARRVTPSRRRDGRRCARAARARARRALLPSSLPPPWPPIRRRRSPRVSTRSGIYSQARRIRSALPRRTRRASGGLAAKRWKSSTQIARTQSLRRQFAAADATLDAIAAEARRRAAARARALPARARAHAQLAGRQARAP